MISTTNLAALPDVPTLIRIMQSMATLDAILCEEWEYRYFSFDSQWSDHEQFGSMRDGQGDELLALFNSAGCWVMGIAHEADIRHSKLSKQLFDHLPSEFADCLKEPAFEIQHATMCIGRQTSDFRWQRAPIALPREDFDGSTWLLKYFDGRPETYRSWAAEYYEREIPLDDVQAIYNYQPITAQLFAKLSCERELSEIVDDLKKIGYPLQ